MTDATDPPELKSLETMVSNFVLVSNPEVADLVCRVATSALDAVNDQADAFKKVQERLGDQTKFSGKVAQICSEILTTLQKEHKRVADECALLTAVYTPTAKELVSRIPHQIMVPAYYPMKFSTLWTGKQAEQTETVPEINGRMAAFRATGVTDPFGDDEFWPGRFDKLNWNHWTGGLNSVGQALFLMEVGDRSEVRQLLDVYDAAGRKLNNQDFQKVSLPDVDANDGNQEIKKEVKKAVDDAKQPKPFTNPAGVNLGDLSAGAASPLAPASTPDAGTAADDANKPQFTAGSANQPTDAAVDNSSYGAAGADPGGIPMRSDVPTAAANSLNAPAGGSNGPGGAGSSVLPYVPGAGAGLAPGTNGLGGTGAAGKLAELDWHALIGLVNVAPAGVIDSPPSPGDDNETGWA
ncbi:MAG TPA: hypothetical protein VH561_12900 [Micromonosporaceae bacterium]